jgi:ankyrin repeat protein
MSPDQAAAQVESLILLPLQQETKQAPLDDRRIRDIKNNIRKRRKGVLGSGKGSTLFLALAEYGSVHGIRMLLEKGATVNESDYAGNRALDLAVLYNHPEVVQVLLENGVAVDRGEDTALINVAEKGRTSILKDLIKAGANIKHKGGYGMTALHWAAARGHNGVIRILLQHGANPNERDELTRTPMTMAEHWHNTTSAEILLAHGGID